MPPNCSTFAGMLHNHGVIFAYSGYVTEPVLSGVGEALKQKLTIDDADTKTLAQRIRRVRRADAEHHPLFGREVEAPLPPASDERAASRRCRYGILTIGQGRQRAMSSAPAT